MNALTQRSAWQFLIPLALQSALIVAVPLQSAITYTTGQPVTLKTRPVDPYDFLRGYSQTLRYEISEPGLLEELPGGKDILKDKFDAHHTQLYVVVQASSSDPAWEPIRVSRDRPRNLPPGQAVLKGKYERGLVKYGLETYYMPEKQRKRINQEIRAVQQDDSQAFLVDIRVNEHGGAVPVSLWVGDRQYQF